VQGGPGRAARGRLDVTAEARDLASCGPVASPRGLSRSGVCVRQLVGRALGLDLLSAGQQLRGGQLEAGGETAEAGVARVALAGLLSAALLKATKRWGMPPLSILAVLAVACLVLRGTWPSPAYAYLLNSAEATQALNLQRETNGIPAGITDRAEWDGACAAHLHWLDLNPSAWDSN
jgi:hypothetical protein